MTITKVSYQIDQNDQVAVGIFNVVRANSALLASLKQAVLDSANDMQSMPGGAMPCNPNGGHWDSPTGQSYHIFWTYMRPNQQMKLEDCDTVILSWIH